MPTLSELQQHFISGLDGVDEIISSFIKTNLTLTAKEYVAIYQDSVIGALQKSLTEIYPVCNKLVGQDFFIVMVNAYIEQNRSLSPDLACYGDKLADFIVTFKAAKSLPYLPDVARLEWAWHKIQSAAKSQQINFEELANCYETCGEKIIFFLPVNSSLLTSPYPVHQIWEVNQDSHRGDNAVILENNMKFNFLIWRQESMMRIELVDEAEWKILKYIQTGYTLSEIHKHVTESSAIELEKILPTMVKKGWIAEFTVKK